MEEQQEQPQVTLKNVSFLTSDQMAKDVEKMARDMSFYSIFNIVYGALLSLTIVGAILGVPLIIYNIKLNDSGKSFRTFVKTNDFFHLSKAFENQRKFFFFYKVLLILSLVFMVLYFIAIIYFIATGFDSIQDLA